MDIIESHSYSICYCNHYIPFETMIIQALFHLPMTSWTDKVETGMDSSIMVGRETTFYLQFFLKVIIKLFVNVVNNGSETVFFVYLISIANSVNDCQLQWRLKEISISNFIYFIISRIIFIYSFNLTPFMPGDMISRYANICSHRQHPTTS